MASRGMRRPTAPGSGAFQVTIESPPPSDPCTRLDELKRSTEALHDRLLLHEDFNAHMDDVIDRMRIRERRRNNGE